MAFLLNFVKEVLSYGIGRRQQGQENWELMKTAAVNFSSAISLGEQAYGNAQTALGNAEQAMKAGSTDSETLRREGQVGAGRNIVSQASGLFSSSSGSFKQLQNQFSAGVRDDIATRMSNAEFESGQAMADYDTYILELERQQTQAGYWYDYFHNIMKDDPYAITGIGYAIGDDFRIMDEGWKDIFVDWLAVDPALGSK